MGCMNTDNLSRRDFIHNASVISAATIATGIANTNGAALPAGKETIDTSRILNYNPKMGYRRLRHLFPAFASALPQ